MKDFLDAGIYQHSKIQVLLDFLEEEKKIKQTKNYETSRFVGYALNIGYNELTMITSDPYKLAVGGIPRNSFLIMVPNSFNGYPPHFILLRVIENTATPLAREVSQTYFELQKRSMPELDVFTQSELQWSALKTEILGMFYPNPDDMTTIEFSGDLVNYVAAHKYRIYAPNDALLDLIVNSFIEQENSFSIGKLRLTESRLTSETHSLPEVNVKVNTKDFMGTRTALFGKTRLGKSNTIKLIIQSLIETTKSTRNVGQVIFDINGEYANDNPQNRAISSLFPEETIVYSLNTRRTSQLKPLKMNFYKNPDKGFEILTTLLQNDNQSSAYVRNFINVTMPSLDDYQSENAYNEKLRMKRKILLFWAILKKAGFDADEPDLLHIFGNFNPKFNQKVMEKIQEERTITEITSLDDLVTLFESAATKNRTEKLQSSSGKNLFDPDDEALLDFLKPKTGRGTKLISPYRFYHDKNADNFIREILEFLHQGKTIIIDLGNAHPRLMEYYSDYLSKKIFAHQVELFSNNALRNHYIQLYFEEAHNLFPKNDTATVDIYRRLAKEGAKYHIGIVYATQSVSSIHPDLLAQTENFFIAHLSSQYEVNALGSVNSEYSHCKQDILKLKTKGYIRMLTRSHRFVIPVQIHVFGGDS